MRIIKPEAEVRYGFLFVSCRSAHGFNVETARLFHIQYSYMFRCVILQFRLQQTVWLTRWKGILVLCKYSIFWNFQKMWPNEFWFVVYIKQKSKLRNWGYMQTDLDSRLASPRPRPRLWCPRPRPTLKTYKTNTGSPWLRWTVTNKKTEKSWQAENPAYW